MYESIRIFHGIEWGYIQSQKRLELRSSDLLATILVSYLEHESNYGYNIYSNNRNNNSHNYETITTSVAE